MPSPEAIAALRVELANDAAALCRVTSRIVLTTDQVRGLRNSDPCLTATAFELHNYYCVSENLMHRVAMTFENALDPTEWHKHLVERMALNINGMRPALIDRGLRTSLHELRKFRHFFRNAYDRELDPGKVAENLQIQINLHMAWLAVIQHFVEWLDELMRRVNQNP